MKRHVIVLIFVALAAAFSLSACGQRGPLKLPDAPKPSSGTST